MSAPRVLFEGAAVTDTWPRMRALHYGDGVFRTLRIHDGRPLDWLGQCAQLLADAARLELELHEEQRRALAAEAALLARAQGAGVLKLVLSRAPVGRGYAPAGRAAQRLLLADPLPALDPRAWSEGVEAGLSPLRLAPQPLLAGIKHLNRLEQVLASRALAPPEAELLLCDDHGSLICGLRSNLFALMESVLVTPRLDRCGVAGRTRARVLEQALALGIPCQQRPLSLAEFATAKECFLTNSLFGIWPLRRFREQEFAVGGALVRALSQALDFPQWPGSESRA